MGYIIAAREDTITEEKNELHIHLNKNRYVKISPHNPNFSFKAMQELLNVVTDLLTELGYAKVSTCLIFEFINFIL